MYSLALAESFDAWRIIPRLILILYALLVVNLYTWYKTIPTYVQEGCDAATMQIFIANKIPVEDARKAACTVKGVVGGPTTSQTTFVTTIIGLTSVIFGFYTGTGRKWERAAPEEYSRGGNNFPPMDDGKPRRREGDRSPPTNTTVNVVAQAPSDAIPNTIINNNPPSGEAAPDNPTNSSGQPIL